MGNKVKGRHHHVHPPKKKPFFRTRKFQIIVIVILFGMAFWMKGERITTTILIARIVDTVGDVFTDLFFHSEDA